MQTVYSSTGKNSAEAWKSWFSTVSQEFYDGEHDGELNDPLDLTFDKALAYPISLTHLTSRAPVGFRRSWQHIRNNKIGTRVIWFIQRGALKISRTQGMCTIKAGEAGIVDTNAPFHAKLVCDADSIHESYQALVPAHLFQRHLPQAEQMLSSFSVNTPDGQVVKRLLEILIGSGDHLRRNTAEPLIDSFLEAIADSTGCRAADLPRRQRLSDKRLADIENYILMRLTDPDLCYEKVAAGCGISPRYLCYVLKANNTCFSDLLWGNRLPKARELLVAPATRDYLIHEIAFMSGFKSAAHFSRMFKTAYGCSPREYRAAQGIGDGSNPIEEPAGNGEMARKAA